MQKTRDLFKQLKLPPLDIPLSQEPEPLVEILEPQVVTVMEEDRSSDRLHQLVERSLDVLDEVLNQPMPPISHPNYLKILSIRKDAAVSGVNIGLKADENRFRKRKNDVLGQLLAQIKSEKERAPLLEQRPQ